MATKGRGGRYESPSLHTLMRRSWERPTERDLAEILGALPLFARLSKRQVRGLAKLAKVADYSPRDVIVQVGDRGDSFYVVLEGRARVVGRSRALGPGDFLGEMALLDGGPRSATVTAETSVRAMRLPRRGFEKALKQDPGMARAIMEELAGRVRRLERKMFA
jgi:CRP/FNR family transcriptional regulator, cyclic AMP receptor protein